MPRSVKNWSPKMKSPVMPNCHQFLPTQMLFRLPVAGSRVETNTASASRSGAASASRTTKNITGEMPWIPNLLTMNV